MQSVICQWQVSSCPSRQAISSQIPITKSLPALTPFPTPRSTSLFAEQRHTHRQRLQPLPSDRKPGIFTFSQAALHEPSQNKPCLHHLPHSSSLTLPLTSSLTTDKTQETTQPHPSIPRTPTPLPSKNGQQVDCRPRPKALPALGRAACQDRRQRSLRRLENQVQ